MRKIITYAIIFSVVISCAIADEYRASPGDRLSIYVVGYAGYNQQVIVRSDGKISYVGGDLDVQGCTPEEIANKIEDRLGRYINNPGVFVSPLPKKNAIYVMGAVTSPNVYKFGATDKLELRQAIAMAGGMPESGADLTKVAVVKNDGQVDRYDITQLDNFQPVYVYPGETVIVPELKYIEVKGNVQEPGKYRIRGEKIRIDHALAMAGGPLYDADLPDLVIYRVNGKRIHVELEEEFWKDTAATDKAVRSPKDGAGGEDRYFLYPDDVLFVPNAFKTERVKVLGAVRNAGSYRIRHPIDAIEALSLSGGVVRSSANLEDARIIRSDKSIEIIDLSKYPQEKEILLYPGDTLEIPEKKINWYLVLKDLVLNILSTVTVVWVANQLK